MKIYTMLFALLVVSAQGVRGGRIFLSHLDADYEASFEPCAACFDPAAAQQFIRTAIGYVRAGSPKPFLYVESNIIPPYADLVSRAE